MTRATVTNGVSALTNRVIGDNSIRPGTAAGGGEPATAGTVPAAAGSQAGPWCSGRGMFARLATFVLSIAGLPAVVSRPAAGGSDDAGVAAGRGSDPVRRWWTIAAFLIALALPLVLCPALASRTFVPKFAVLLLLGALGLVPLLRELKYRPLHLPAWAASGFLLVALVSALMSRAPNIGIFGLYDWGTGWFLWLGSAGAYAIGRRLQNAADLEWLFRALVVAGIANSLLGLWQALEPISTGPFAAYNGTQADGFLGNPIFLESLLLGVIALAARRAVQRPLLWSAPLLLMSVALELTTERLAVALLAVLFLWLVFRHRLRGACVSALVASGYAIGYLGGGSSLGTRIAYATKSPGLRLRLDIWSTAGRAIIQRPLMGYGPGELESGVNHLIGISFARALGPDQLFTDAHDIFVEVAVTTGVVGLALFLVWLLGGLRQACNDFVAFALMALAVELVEPLNVAITPLLFLALGAASVRLSITASESAPRIGLPGRCVTGVLAAAALALAGTMIVGDAALNNSPPAAYSLSEARTASSWLPYWPQGADALTAEYRYQAAVSHGSRSVQQWLRRALRASREAEGRLPFDPLAVDDVGQSYLGLGKYGAARAEFLKARRAEPYNAAALSGLGDVALDERQWKLATRLFRLELSVIPRGSGRRVPEHGLRLAAEHRTPRAMFG